MAKILILVVTVLGCLSATAQTVDGSADVLSTAGRAECGYVQLWEDGPRWATFNVGATITDYGQLQEGADPTPFYNYKELAPYYNTANIGGSYPWNNPNHNGRQMTWTSSVETGLADVAATLWGSNWCTPTREQMDSLQNPVCGLTTWTWYDGVESQYKPGCVLSGYKVSGVGAYADKAIFLPATGCFYHDHDAIYGAGNYADYWTGTPSDDENAYSFGFLRTERRNLEPFERAYGESIRPVLADGVPTSLSSVRTVTKPTKFIHNHQLVIRHGKQHYNVLGIALSDK